MISFLLTLLVAAAHGDAKAEKAGPLEAIAKAGVGSVLSHVLDTPCSAGGVKLNLREQFLELHDVRIGNPKGFSAGDAIQVKTVRVEADPKSLFSDEPTIRLVQVGGVSVEAIGDVKHGVNLEKLASNAKRFKLPAFMTAAPKKKWRIEKAVLEDGVIDMTVDALGKHTTRKTLDRMDMDFMGQDGKGMTADEAMAKVMQILMDKAGLLGGSDGLKSLKDLVVL